MSLLLRRSVNLLRSSRNNFKRFASTEAEAKVAPEADVLPRSRRLRPEDLKEEDRIKTWEEADQLLVKLGLEPLNFTTAGIAKHGEETGYQIPEKLIKNWMDQLATFQYYEGLEETLRRNEPFVRQLFNEGYSYNQVVAIVNDSSRYASHAHIPAPSYFRTPSNYVILGMFGVGVLVLYANIKVSNKKYGINQ